MYKAARQQNRKGRRIELRGDARGLSKRMTGQSDPADDNHAPEPGNSSLPSGKRGYILPMVLIIAVIAILFGFGRLLLFRYQCEIRFDRQREIDRKLATRSALRWLESEYPPPETTNTFTYYGSNGRPIVVTVHRKSSIYPRGEDHLVISDCPSIGDVPSHVSTNSTHLDMAPGLIEGENQDYDLKIGSASQDVATVRSVGRIMIDMEGLGSWLDDTYGRRYWVEPENVNKNGEDEMRFCLTPRGESFANDNEAAIWVEQTQDAPAIPVTLKVRDAEGNVETLATTENIGNIYSRGMQLAGDTISLFHWWPPGGSDFGEYVFHGNYELPADVVAAFSNTDVRLTLEVEASGGSDDADNSFRWIRVDPAYEYDILLGDEMEEVATVVHLRPEKRGKGGSTPGKVFTYDTHGTSKD